MDRCNVLLAALAAVGCLSVSTYAQAQPVEETPPVERQEIVDDQPLDAAAEAYPQAPPLPTVVITATRTPRPTDEVGSSISVITDEQLRLKQQRFVTEALQSVPGVDVRTSGRPGSQTSIFIRGANPEHTVFLLDGIDLVDVTSPAGAPIVDHLLSTGLGRLEVLRGPQGTLYGSNAIGGVIQGFTPRGQGAPTLTLSAEAGSYDTTIERATFQGGVEDLGYFFAFSRVDVPDGRSISPAGTEEDPYRNTSFSNRLDFDVSEQLSIQGVIHYIEAANEFDGFGSDNLFDQTESEQLALKLEPRLWLLDGQWEQRLKLAFADQERRSQTFGMFGADRRYDSELFEIDWQNNLYLTENNTLTAGIEHRWEEADLDGNHFDTDTLSFYIQDQLEPIENLYLTLGARHDDYETFGSQTTLRAAGAYVFDATGTTVRGSWGQGFKAPTLNQLFDPLFGTGNPNLEAEESEGWDVGVEQALFDRQLTLGATYFENDIDQLITTAAPAFVYVNIDEARTRGVEAFVAWNPSERWLLRADYTYTDTENVGTGARLLRRPLHNASASVSYLFDEDRGDLTLAVVYVGEREDIDPATFATVTAESYTRVDLAGSYQLTEQLRLFGRVENLLDEEYEDVLGYQNATATAYAGLEYRF